MCSSLLSLAQEHLSSLNEVEQNLFRGIAKNGQAFCDGATIRAKCLTWLCNSKQAKSYLTDQGIQIEGAYIVEELGLNYIHLDVPFIIQRSEIHGKILLENSELHTLKLTETRLLKGLHANGLTVKFGLDLSDSTIEENIQLSMASIGGNLDFSRSKVRNFYHNQYALRADGARIQGGAYLDGDSESNRFESEGEVCFSGAHFKGGLKCSYGLLSNPTGKALSADGAKIDGNLFADRAKFKGEIFLSLARIGGDVSFRGSQLESREISTPALSLDAASIKSSLFLDKGFSAIGTVNLSNTKVSDTLIIKDVKSPQNMQLNLHFANVGTLEDDAQSWPGNDNLRLSGFEYKTIDRELPGNEKMIVNGHLSWLQIQSHKHRTYKAYDVLAKALQNDAQEKIARKIKIHRRRDYRKFGNISFIHVIWELFLDITVAYGYQPERMAVVAIVLILLGQPIFYQAYQEKLITATFYSEIEVYEDSSYEHIDTNKLDETYPRFHAFFYSIDTFIPIIDIQQDRYWHINTKETSVCIDLDRVCIPAEGIRWYLRIHIVLGWLVTSLFVAALAGFVKKELF